MAQTNGVTLEQAKKDLKDDDIVIFTTWFPNTTDLTGVVKRGDYRTKSGEYCYIVVTNGNNAVCLGSTFAIGEVIKIENVTA